MNYSCPYCILFSSAQFELSLYSSYKHAPICVKLSWQHKTNDQANYPKKSSIFQGQTVRTRQSEVMDSLYGTSYLSGKRQKLIIIGSRPTYNKTFQVTRLEKVYLQKGYKVFAWFCKVYVRPLSFKIEKTLLT